MEGEVIILKLLFGHASDALVEAGAGESRGEEDELPSQRPCDFGLAPR
jgi:hypothetical protein